MPPPQPTEELIKRTSSGPSAQVVLYEPNAFGRLEQSSILVPTALISAPENAWKLLPLPHRLDVDIVFVTQANSKAHVLWMVAKHVPNELLETLLTERDPEDAYFGKPTQRVRGGAALRLRETGTSTSRAVTDTLQLYVEPSLASIRRSWQRRTWWRPRRSAKR